MHLTDALGSLRHRDFRWFFLASSVNRLGSMMTAVAYAFAVLHVDNSASALSQVLAAQVGGNVLCALFGGVIADRLSRRVVLQSTYVSSALVLGVTASLLLSGQATVALLTLLAALAGAASAFSAPAVQGIVPQLVPRADLQQANALISLVRNGASFIGPVLGAMLVAIGGAPWALVIDAGSFALASMLLLGVRLPGAARRQTRIIRDLREGWGEFTSRTWLWVIVVAFGFMNAIHSGAVLVLGPLIAKNTTTLGIAGWGWVMGAEAVGMLVMSAILLRLPLRHPLRTGMMAIPAVALFIALLGLHPVTLPLMAVSFLGGAGMEIFGTGWNVSLGERVPSTVLSRVSSYDILGSFVAMPFGMLVYGALATVVPLPLLLAFSGALYALIALSTLSVRSIRTMQRLPDNVTS